jgi:transposase
MSKLTVTQIASAIGVSIYTLKRWYDWYEQEDIDKLEELKAKGMPQLPAYETIGATKWRYWEEKDIEQLKKFKEFMPHTRGGFMGSLNKKGKK